MVLPSLAQKKDAPNLFPVRHDGKWGYIDSAGRMVIAPQFDAVENFTAGPAVISEKRKYGYIDRTGRVVVAPEFDTALPFSGGLAKIYMKGKHGYTDKTGNFVCKPSK